MIIAFDTETQKFRPGLMAPPLACLSWATSLESFGIFDSTPEGLSRMTPALRSASILVFANLGYDLPVLAANRVLSCPDVFAMLDAGKVRDVFLREKLLDLAEGQLHGYWQRDGAYFKRKYDLASLAFKYLGITVTGKKAEEGEDDPVRLRYGEVIGIPFHAWPEEFRRYALDDPRYTIAIYHAQTERAETLRAKLGADPLADEVRQTRRAWALALIAIWGIYTDPNRIDVLDTYATNVFETLIARLSDRDLEEVVDGSRAPLVRLDGSRNTKAAKIRMLRVCAENGVTSKITKTAEKKIKDGEIPDVETAIRMGYVCLDADACNESGDGALHDYARLTTFRTVLSKDVKALKAGIAVPIHTRIDTLKETGRPSSSSPNIFNIRGSKDKESEEFKVSGIRECFRASPGTWFLNADVSGLELGTLAQVLLRWIGWSKMADAIRTYGDPGALHTLMAGALLGGLSFDETKALIKAKDKHAAHCRSLAKIANFGFPGGLGIDSLIYFARAKFGVRLTREEAQALRKAWLAQWPEMREYFGIARAATEGGRGRLVQLFSDRIRGGVRFTEFCNGPFQGLGADATGEATYELQRECYAIESSPLYGSRVTNYVYDEWLIEVPADARRATACASRLVEVVTPILRKWCPDLPMGLGEPVLFKNWTKDGEPVQNAEGLLVPCDL